MPIPSPKLQTAKRSNDFPPPLHSALGRGTGPPGRFRPEVSAGSRTGRLAASAPKTDPRHPRRGAVVPGRPAAAPAGTERAGALLYLLRLTPAGGARLPLARARCDGRMQARVRPSPPPRSARIPPSRVQVSSWAPGCGAGPKARTLPGPFRSRAPSVLNSRLPVS